MLLKAVLELLSRKKSRVDNKSEIGRKEGQDVVLQMDCLSEDFQEMIV